MELYEINPYVRFANKRSYIKPYENFVMAYDYRLFYVCSGSIEIVFEDQTANLTENRMTIIPPAIKYKIEKSDFCEYIVINFDMDFSMFLCTQPIPPQNAGDFDKNNILSVNLYNEVPIFLLGGEQSKKNLDEICVEYTEKSFYHNEKNSALLKSIIVESVIYTKRDNTPKIVDKIKKYIDGNYNKNISNKEIGDVFGYHPNHINRLFKTYIQMSIHEFITDIRLTKAITMISKTDLTIGQIGELCGFSSDAYFIKKFKEKYGISPLKFRNQKFNKI